MPTINSYQYNCVNIQYDDADLLESIQNLYDYYLVLARKEITKATPRGNSLENIRCR